MAPGPPHLPGLSGFLDQFGAEHFIFSSDWTHCEGLADPYRQFRATVGERPAEIEERLYGGNLAELFGVPA